MYSYIVLSSILSFGFTQSLLGIGPVDVSGIDADNKRFWDESVVITGVVVTVSQPRKNWRMIDVSPTCLISGDVDPAVTSIVQIGFENSLLNNFPIPSKGDRILVIMRRKSLDIDSDIVFEERENAVFELPMIKVKADVGIGPISILDQNGEHRTQALLERIRLVRAFSAK